MGRRGGGKGEKGRSGGKFIDNGVGYDGKSGLNKAADGERKLKTTNSKRNS